jgi:hypothetical protein
MTNGVSALTDEIDQIVNIIQLALPTYSVSKTVQNIAPSVYLEIDSVNSHSVVKEQTYQLHIMSTSAANLKTAIDTLLKLDLSHPDAYTIPNASYCIKGTISDEADDIYQSIPSVHTYYPHEVNGFVFYRNTEGNELSRSSVFIFTLDKSVPPVYALSSATFTITPSITTTHTATIETVGCDQDTPDVLTKIWTDDIQTKTLPTTTAQTSAEYGATTWVKDTSIEIDVKTIFEEIIARSNWDKSKIGLLMHAITGIDAEDFALYMKDPFDTNDSSILAQLDLVYTFNFAGFPYELEMKYKNQQITENIFEADVLMLARWSNI